MQSNGLGPWWFPSRWRAGLGRLCGTFFDEASWQRHDEGYARGSPPRNVCDRLFLAAMLRDASHAPSVFKIWECCGVSFLFWVLVRGFGWASYNRMSLDC